MIRTFLPYNLCALAVLALYSAFCVSRFGGTPGKRICKLRVVRGTGGGQVSFRPGAGAASPPSWGPGSVPYVGIIYRIVDALFIAFDGQKHAALHDLICDTRVVEETPGLTPLPTATEAFPCRARPSCCATSAARS